MLREGGREGGSKRKRGNPQPYTLHPKGGAAGGGRVRHPGSLGASPPLNVYPLPDTLYPIPCTLYEPLPHSTYTLCPVPCTLYPTPLTSLRASLPLHVYPLPYTLYHILLTIDPIPCTLYNLPFGILALSEPLPHSAYTLCPVPYTLYPVPCTLYPTPLTSIRASPSHHVYPFS